MTDILTQVRALYNANDALKAALPRFYAGEAPQNTAMPYGVYTIVSNAPIKTLGGILENVRIQFAIFQKGTKPISNITDIADLLKTAYDHGITTTTGHVWWAHRVMDMVFKVENEWEAVIDYRIEKHYEKS